MGLGGQGFRKEDRTGMGGLEGRRSGCGCGRRRRAAGVGGAAWRWVSASERENVELMHMVDI